MEKLLEPVSNTIRRTASFLGIFNAGEEPEVKNTLRRICDTRSSNTMGRTTSILNLFKAGNPGEGGENPLLQTMKKKDSMNLSLHLRCNESLGDS